MSQHPQIIKFEIKAIMPFPNQKEYFLIPQSFGDNPDVCIASTVFIFNTDINYVNILTKLKSLK